MNLSEIAKFIKSVLVRPTAQCILQNGKLFVSYCDLILHIENDKVIYDNHCYPLTPKKILYFVRYILGLDGGYVAHYERAKSQYKSIIYHPWSIYTHLANSNHNFAIFANKSHVAFRIDDKTYELGVEENLNIFNAINMLSLHHLVTFDEYINVWRRYISLPDTPFLLPAPKPVYFCCVCLSAEIVYESLCGHLLFCESHKMHVDVTKCEMPECNLTK